MKRIAVTVLALLLMVSSAWAANFYWKDTFAALDAITGLANGDRGIVYDNTGVVTFYYRTGGVWASATSLVLGQGAATAGTIKLYELSGGGTNFVAWKAPDALAGDVTWTLPSADAAGLFYSNGSGTVTLSTSYIAAGTATGGLIFGDASPDTAGEIGYSTGLILYGENSEDLKIAVGSASNTVTVSSNTGVTDMSFSAINLATTGTISGAIPILDNVADPTAAQMYGSLNLVNAAITVTLPTAVAGMSGCVLDSGTAHDIIVDVQAGDDIEMTAGQQTNGVGITNAGGSSTADFVCVIAPSAGHWVVFGNRGTWASQ